VVVLKTTKSAMMRKAESGRSPTSSETGTPAAHVMTTLYTLRPMYLESLSAAMLTLRVSHARKQPNTYAVVRPRSTQWTGVIADRAYLHSAALRFTEAPLQQNVAFGGSGHRRR